MATVHVAGAEEATGTHSHRRQQSPEGKRETVLGLNLSLPRTDWVTLDKPLNLSEPQLPHLEKNLNSQDGYKD